MPREPVKLCTLSNVVRGGQQRREANTGTAVVGGPPNHDMREVVRIHDESASWPDCVKPPDSVSIAFRKPLREAQMSSQSPKGRDRLSLAEPAQQACAWRMNVLN